MSAYLQNVSPFGLARIARQQSNARSYFDFRSPKFHHHSSVESLQKAAEIGCYICVLLMKAFMTRCSATELQSLDYDGSFTIYEYENGFEYSKQHPQRFETTIRYQRNASLSIPICPHISVMAFPALGKWRKGSWKRIGHPPNQN